VEHGGHPGDEVGGAKPGDQPRARTPRLIVSPSALDDQVRRLNVRIDDEIRGLEQRTTASLLDEVARLEELVRALYLRIDTFIAEFGRVDQLIDTLEIRLAEAVELAGQRRSAERLEARRSDALEARVTDLERNAAQGE